MSKIDDHIKKLRELENKLKLEKLKIEFLRHILESAKNYNHAAFAEVKNDVVLLLDKFVNTSIEQIETGGSENPQPTKEAATSVKPFEQEVPKKNAEDLVGPNDKLAFALEHRHLAGKGVSVENDKNMSVRGKVVGLDAPFVLVQTETGPIIKVPVNKVSLS